MFTRQKTQKNSMTKRFMRYLIGIIILSNLLVFGFLYTIMERSMTQQILDRSQNLMEANLNVIESYFQDIDDIAGSIVYNKDIIRFMKGKTDRQAQLELLYNMESMYYNSRPDLSMTFFKEGNYTNMYSIMEGERAVSMEDYRYTKWYQEIIWTDEPKVLFSDNSGDDEDFVHSMVYRIEDVYENKTVGYLKIDMDLSALKERFLQEYANVEGITITDAQGNLLFWEGKAVQVPNDAYQKGSIVSYETKDSIMSLSISKSTGWRLCVAMSRDAIFAGQRAMVGSLIAILVVIVLFTMLISGKCFSVITENFKRLAEGMNDVKQGNLQAHVEPDAQDEISILIQEFNEMVSRVNELVQTVEAKQILLKEAEIKALQQQINPHFMSNIMETIMGLASEGMDDEVIRVSECMSDMLRYNTRFENTTTLREELEQVKNYVSVLQIRFEDRFEAFYDVDEECMDCKMVKFTLQPLVENAISHGLSQTETDGMIRIRVKKEDDHISIMIFDNGIGMTNEMREELIKRLTQTAEHPLEYINQYKSLGILNVHLRLRMYYGEAYSIELFSKEGRGTCFSIKIPFIENELEKKNS